MGFNPFRRTASGGPRPADYVMLVVALLVVAALLLWALVPR